MRDGDLSPIGHVVPHIKSDEIVDKAVQTSGYRKPKRKYTGRGIAITQWLPLGGEAHAVVTIGGDGRITVATGMVDQGAGTYTAMRQIAANELMTPVELVKFEILDTGKIAPDTGVGASRATRIFGNATQLAAAEACRAIIDAARKLWDTTDKLTLTGDGAVRAKTGRTISTQKSKEIRGTIHVAAFQTLRRRARRRSGFRWLKRSGSETGQCIKTLRRPQRVE